MTSVEPKGSTDDASGVAALTAGLVESEDALHAGATAPSQQHIVPDDLLPGVGGELVSLRRAVEDNGVRLLAGLSLLTFLAPAAAGGLAAAAGDATGWRWPSVAIGCIVLVAAGLTFTLRELARYPDEQLLATGRVLDTAGIDEDPIPFSAGIDRLLKARTLKFLLPGIGVLGVALVTVPTFVFLVLEQDYGLGPLERGAVGGLIELGALVGIVVGGVLGQRLFRRSPPSVILFVGAGQGLFGLLFSAVITFDSLPLLVGGLFVANISHGLALVPVYTFVAAVVPHRLRRLAFSLLGLFILLVGGLLGNLVLGSLSDGRGPRAALLAAVPMTALIGAGLTAYGSRFVRRDLSLVVQEACDDQAERERLEEGGEVAMLQVRNLDFSYGPVQVLFDVSLDVHRGEVLALLGTNGAGKSTVLRAITGLQLPDRGSVRFDGRPITYLEAETRVGMGIVQVPGGKAIFPTLTVAENLLAGAHRFIWDRALVEERVEASLDLFPRLRERLDQSAGTLSGGEQQQLAIAKALLLDPQLLCIDELSLGLAPVIVQDILATVEQLKQRGVTMVIVEQSVNVALSIADRAIFMEKGQVKFEGPAQQLLERDDLVRAVFLGGEGG